MTKIKQYIDWLFWKRYWFRYIAITFPIWLPLVFRCFGYVMQEGGTAIQTMGWIYFGIFSLSILDDKNMGHPIKPDKKQVDNGNL